MKPFANESGCSSSKTAVCNIKWSKCKRVKGHLKRVSLFFNSFLPDSFWSEAPVTNTARRLGLAGHCYRQKLPTSKLVLCEPGHKHRLQWLSGFPPVISYLSDTAAVSTFCHPCTVSYDIAQIRAYPLSKFPTIWMTHLFSVFSKQNLNVCPARAILLCLVVSSSICMFLTCCEASYSLFYQLCFESACFWPLNSPTNLNCSALVCLPARSGHCLCWICLLLL